VSSLRSRLMWLFIKYGLTRKLARLSLPQTREFYDDIGRKSRVPKQIKTEKIDVCGLPAESLSGPGALDGKVILYLHGGGYTVGSCDAYRHFVAHISLAAKMRLVLVEYRLAPENPFPAALDDAVAAYRWLLDNGIPAKCIALAGDSAGGGLAMATAVCLRDKKIALPGAIVCMSPWVDLCNTGESSITESNKGLILIPEMLKSCAASYVGKNDHKNPLISPLYADLSGLPPILIQAGSREIILNDSTRLAERARNAGVDVTLEVWDGMWHVWQAFTDRLPESMRAIKGIGEFLRKHMEAN
jgi:epsilon-lactone hydrolase